MNIEIMLLILVIITCCVGWVILGKVLWLENQVKLLIEDKKKEIQEEISTIKLISKIGKNFEENNKIMTKLVTACEGTFETLKNHVEKYDNDVANCNKSSSGIKLESNPVINPINSTLSLEKTEESKDLTKSTEVRKKRTTKKSSKTEE